MTALILQATPYVELARPRLQTLYQSFLRALDRFAEAKMRNAVPLRHLREAQREIDRYRRLASAAGAKKPQVKAYVSPRHAVPSTGKR